MRKILAGLVVTAALACGQPAPAGIVLGVGNFIHDVSDLNKSLQFYHEVVGMDLQGTPPGPGEERAFSSATEVPRLYNAVGAQFRVGAAIVPGSPMRSELVEFKGIDRKPVQPRIQDPGASVFVVTERDLRPIMAAVKRLGVTVVTTGGQPVKLEDKSLAIVLKDPDGFYVELVQLSRPPGTNAAADTNPLEAAFHYTVSDLGPMLAVFKDALGFKLVATPFVADKAEAKLFGLHGDAQIRRATALVPGTTFEVSFLEFKGVERTPVHSRPQDPGSGVLRLLVGDLDFAVETLEKAGVKVVSAGGPVTLPAGPGNTIRAAIASAPDNLFVQVLARPAK